MGWVIFVLSVSTTGLLWRRATGNLKKSGRSWIFRHWAGASIGGTVGIMQAILLAGEAGIGTVIGFGITAVVLALHFDRDVPHTNHPGAPAPSSGAIKGLSPVAEKIYREESDGDAAALVRRWKEKSAGTRKSKFNIDEDGGSIRKPNPVKVKAKVSGKVVVQFDYIDAEGDFSSRRVKVNRIGDRYFEGIDLDIQETRTFRLDRVQGGVMSEATGEIEDAETWAAILHSGIHP